MHAEAQGESLEGLMAVAEAALTRAKNKNTTVCQVTGVSRRLPPMGLKQYYRALAVAAFTNSKRSLVGNADSWNVGRKPHKPGVMKRIIGRHTFYTALKDK